MAILLTAFSDRLGDITIFPLWSDRNRPAKRVIVQAKAGSNGPTTVMPGLEMHQPSGIETASAKAVLREGSALHLNAK